jgi:hypothetical protein
MNAAPALWHDSIEEAIAEACLALGGKKAVAVLLWPSMTVREAHNRLDASLNPERREKLSPSELLMIAKLAREAGCHAVMGYLCSEAGYQAPIPREPEDERAKLQREFIAAQKSMQALAQKMERAGLFRVVA